MIVEYFLYKNVQQNGNSNGVSTENYHNPNTKYYYQNGIVVQQKELEEMSAPVLIVVFVLYLAIGIYAAKLSWNSNTKVGWSQGYKILFSIFAFMFPFTYIYSHIIFKLDLLSKIKRGNSYKY